MGESFHSVQHLDPPFLFMDERVIFIPRGRQLDVNNRMLKIILFFDGSADLFINKRSLGQIEPGDALLVSRPCRQIYQPVENREIRMHILRIFFDFNTLGLHLLREGKTLAEQHDLEANFAAFVRHHLRDVQHLKGVLDSSVHDCIRLIRREIEKERPGYRYIISAQCRMLVTHLIRKLSGREANPQLALENDSVHVSWAVEHTKFFVCENYNRTLTLGEIAWEVRLSAEHLSRVFKRSTGQTVFEFLRDIRIESAKSHLISSKLSVSEISDLVGFSSPTLFWRNFRKATGCSPTDYRRKSLKKLSFQHTTLNPQENVFLPSMPHDAINTRQRISI